MTELAQVSIVAGIPVGGTGEVPTLAPVRDALLEIRDKILASPATAALQTSTNGKLDILHADLAALAAFVDGLELLIGATNAGNSAIVAKLSADPASQTTLAAVLAKLIAAPATEAKQDALLAAVNKIGTRAYAAGQQIAVPVSTGSPGQTTPITATEIMVVSDVDCYVSSIAAAAPTTGIPVFAGVPFSLRIATGAFLSVIGKGVAGLIQHYPGGVMLVSVGRIGAIGSASPNRAVQLPPGVAYVVYNDRQVTFQNRPVIAPIPSTGA